ncbi:MAG TPA: ribonuclease HI family protein [Candidatus Paceibacterota bacterium]|nr:ribonuclease HI family protein [Candidatus Paceibacterota bacterium]
MEKITIFTDGGARGNPGPAAAGAVIFDEAGKPLQEISEYLGETTNNVAEYEALLRVLCAAQEMFGEKLQDMEVEIKMDSELIVRQMIGIYKVKEPSLKERYVRIKEILKLFPHHTFTHVRREFNKHADKLVNEAIDKALL